jgi:hypothetical protein
MPNSTGLSNITNEAMYLLSGRNVPDEVPSKLKSAESANLIQLPESWRCCVRPRTKSLGCSRRFGRKVA